MISCSSSVTKKEYIEWVENPLNGLNNNKTLGDFSYTIQYKPLEYIVIKKNNELNEKKDFQNLHYIDLTLSNKMYSEYLKIGLEQKEDYYHRLKYFSFGIENDVKLIDGKDSLRCVFSHYERTYGITPYIKIVMAFEKKEESKENLFFTYHDQLFNNGIISIPIKRDELNNIPKIKI